MKTSLYARNYQVVLSLIKQIVKVPQNKVEQTGLHKFNNFCLISLIKKSDASQMNLMERKSIFSSDIILICLAL